MFNKNEICVILTDTENLSSENLCDIFYTHDSWIISVIGKTSEFEFQDGLKKTLTPLLAIRYKQNFLA